MSLFFIPSCLGLANRLRLYSLGFITLTIASSVPELPVLAQKGGVTDQQSPQRVLIARESEAVRHFAESPFAQAFLDAASCLPAIKDRKVHLNPDNGRSMTAAEFNSASEAAKTGFETFVVDETFYYTTRYGSPIANVRAYDIAGMHGLKTANRSRLCDFGFGSIGSLRMMASLGAEVVGTEVFELLRVVYAEPEDTGKIPLCGLRGQDRHGTLSLVFGRWPGDSSARSSLATVAGEGFNLFLSKNTLKRGYIHPSRKFRSRSVGEGLIELGVDDATFAKAVYESLAPEGLFLIYNFSPRFVDTDDDYVPWSDGRCPFDEELLKRTGFEVIAYDVDDTTSAREIASALKWNEQDMDINENLFAMYTLLRRTQ